MFQFYTDFADKCVRDVETTTALVGGADNLTTFDKFVAANAEYFKGL